MGRHSAAAGTDDASDLENALGQDAGLASADSSGPGKPAVDEPRGRHAHGEDPAPATASRLFRPYTGEFGNDDDPAEAETSEFTAIATATRAGSVPDEVTAELSRHLGIESPHRFESTAQESGEDAAGTTADDVTDVHQVRLRGEGASSSLPEAVTSPAIRQLAHTPGTAAERPAPQGTHADLALLRTHPGLRARAAAAVLTPFVLYLLVMTVIGNTDGILLWIWIPIVLAGIGFGLMLDLAQRKADSQPAQRNEAADESDDSTP